MSNVLYYRSILESCFHNILAEKITSRKTRVNYKSDFRHFISWCLKNNIFQATSKKSLDSILIKITPTVIQRYISDQRSLDIAETTINRHLSSLRFFFHAAVGSGILKLNPIEKIENLSKKTIPQNQPDTIVGSFESLLAKEGASKSTIKSYITDVEQFIIWIDNTVHNS